MTEVATQPFLASPASELKIGLKSFGVKLCISITLGVLFLCLGEALAAVYLWLNPEPSPYRNLNLPPDYARDLEASRPQQYVPYVEWRRLPYPGRFINIDRAGLRRTLHSYCDDPKAPVIWIFGDSVTWGTGVTDADTIPSQLAAQYEQAGQKACVVNYGEAGRVSTQEVLEFLLALKHADRKPKVVVFYDGVDHIDGPLEGAPVDRPLAYQRLQHLIEDSQRVDKSGLWFLTKTNTARALQQISEKISERVYKLEAERKSRNGSPRYPASAARDLLSIYQQNMQLVDAVSQQYGFQPFFFWYPTRITSPKPLTKEEQIPRGEELSEETHVRREVYASFRTIHRADFFDLGDMFASETERLYLDDSHLTSKGCFLSAQHIFDILQASRPR